MSGSTTSLDQIERSQAETLISAHLHGSATRDDVAADCALLRSCVWSLMAGEEPVHILRVLNLALSIWDSDEGVQRRREHLHNALEELSETGDLVALPEGRWLPALTREVILEPTSGERMLVGGLPTGILPIELKSLVTHHGPYRRVEGTSLGESLMLPEESLGEWAGSPPENIEAWGEDRLNVELDRYSEPPEGFRISVYAPELAREGTTQFQRWFEHPGSLSGRYLALRKRVFGAREYRVVELREGAIVSSGDVLAPGESRRLMYALDARAGKPVEVRLGANGGCMSVKLRSELPRSEQRLFGALGTLDVPEGNYYPRTWWFEERYREIVLSHLRALRVRLVESGARR